MNNFIDSDYGIRTTPFISEKTIMRDHKNKDIEENPEYLSQQVITYIGNKRSLLSFIGKGIEIAKKKLKKEKLKTFDVFSGSGIVARYLKQYSEKILANDLEKYSEIINKCYLSNKNENLLNRINDYYNQLKNELKESKLKNGFIRELYAPKNIENITSDDRCFYTPRNAKYLDTARTLISKLPEDIQIYFLAPLLAEASIHANTSGVFKGFYKNKHNGIGQWGGSNGDALKRILGKIELQKPIFSNFTCDYEVYRGDSNEISRKIEEVDLAYIDPPYNQHPYGSNYFMLNLIVDYQRPVEVSTVSGIPVDWNRSAYNKKQFALKAMSDLVENIKAKYLLISFNSEGFISVPEMYLILKKVGKVNILETKYNTFRGSRNLRNREIHVKEYLYLVEKK